MPATEIDVIFASKAKPSQAENMSASSMLKGKAKATLDSSEGTHLSGKKTKKKKKSQRTTVEDDNNGPSNPSLGEAATSVKRKRAEPEPETIIDPSASIHKAKRKNTAAASNSEAAPSRMTKQKNTAAHEDFDKFYDSRGTGPRTYTIYPACQRRSLAFISIL